MSDCTLPPTETHLRKYYAKTTVLLREASGMAWASAYNVHHTGTRGALEALGCVPPPQPGAGGRAETPQAQAEGTRRVPRSRRAPAPVRGRMGGGVEVLRGRAAAHHDHRRTRAAATLRRWPQMDGSGYRQRWSQRVVGGGQHGCWHGSRKTVSRVGTRRPRAVFAQSEVCSAALCCLVHPESHKDGASPHKTVERGALWILAAMIWYRAVLYGGWPYNYKFGF